MSETLAITAWLLSGHATRVDAPSVLPYATPTPQPARADPGATPDKGKEQSPDVYGRVRDVSMLEGDVSQDAAKKTGTTALPSDAENVYALSTDLCDRG